MHYTRVLVLQHYIPPKLPSICVTGFTADHTLVCSSGIRFRPSHDDTGNLIASLFRILSIRYTNNFFPARPAVVAELARVPIKHLEGIQYRRKWGWPSAVQGEVYGCRRDGNGTPATTERRATTTAENHCQNAPVQRSQPGAHPGNGRGPGEKDAGNPAGRRVD